MYSVCFYQVTMMVMMKTIVILKADLWSRLLVSNSVKLDREA